ncbi:putative amidohydrolase [Bradyrhizobium sp. LM2.7]
MVRVLRAAAAQMGPTQKADSREHTLGRMLALLEEAAGRGASLVVFPELAFTTFFPRWLLEGEALDQYFERSIPNPAIAKLFDRARALRVGFYVGYAELTPDRRRYNCAILVDRDGEILGRYRKVHLPGSVEPRPGARYQQLEKRYFDYGDLGFPAFRAGSAWAHAIMGMMICNDRRWPESWRVLGLQGVELVCIGYNSAAYDPNGGSTEDAALRTFHSTLVTQANAYMNATWAISCNGGEGGRGGRLRADRRLLHRRSQWSHRRAGQDLGRRADRRRRRSRSLPPGQGQDVQFRGPSAAGAIQGDHRTRRRRRAGCARRGLTKWHGAGNATDRQRS